MLGNYELLKGNASNTKMSPSKSKQDEESTTGLITYQGGVIDIHNLLQKVEKSDQDRLAAERKIEEMELITGNDELLLKRFSHYLRPKSLWFLVIGRPTIEVHVYTVIGTRPNVLYTKYGG